MKECTFEKLYRIVGIITADYGMKHVYIFRFRACGDDTEDSDYDFFVVPNDDCGMFRLTEFFGKRRKHWAMWILYAMIRSKGETSLIRPSRKRGWSMKPDSETMETIIGCCVEIAEYGALRGKHTRSARRSPSWGSANELGVCPTDRQNEVWHPIPDSPLA